MLALLEKLENIEIENNTRLVESDKEYCEQQHSLYIKILRHYRNMFEKMQGVQKYEEDFYTSIVEENEFRNGSEVYKTYGYRFVELEKEKFSEIIINAHNRFIVQINSYFRKKYNVTIEDKKHESYIQIEEPKDPSHSYYYGFSRMSDEEIDKMKKETAKYKLEYDAYLDDVINAELHYDPIIDDIFLSLGGFSFDEKVEREIKDAAIKAVTNSYRNTTYYSLKNGKIAFEHLTYSKKDYDNTYEISLNGDDYRAVLRALTYFNSDGAWTSTYSSWCNNFISYHKKEKDGIFDKHDVGSTKVRQFKYFKNGKFEVSFDNHFNALKFAKEYLGYVA